MTEIRLRQHQKLIAYRENTTLWCERFLKVAAWFEKGRVVWFSPRTFSRRQELAWLKGFPYFNVKNVFNAKGFCVKLRSTDTNAFGELYGAKDLWRISTHKTRNYMLTLGKNRFSEWHRIRNSSRFSESSKGARMLCRCGLSSAHHKAWARLSCQLVCWTVLRFGATSGHWLTWPFQSNYNFNKARCSVKLKFWEVGQSAFSRVRNCFCIWKLFICIFFWRKA